MRYFRLAFLLVLCSVLPARAQVINGQTASEFKTVARFMGDGCLFAAQVSARYGVACGLVVPGDAVFVGTADQVIITEDPAGTFTFSLPQSLNTTDTPQFAGVGIGIAGISGQLTFPDGGEGTGGFYLKPDVNVLALRNTEPSGGVNFALYGDFGAGADTYKAEWSLAGSSVNGGDNAAIVFGFNNDSYTGSVGFFAYGTRVGIDVAGSFQLDFDAATGLTTLTDPFGPATVALGIVAQTPVAFGTPIVGITEDMVMSFTDANTATWGATITAGGGENHVLARYNGSDWTVIGK